MRTKKILNNLNIAKDNFREVLSLNNYSLASLEGYYCIQKEKADRLTLDGEFVGKTYDNLDTIKEVITAEEKQLIKCRAC